MSANGELLIGVVMLIGLVGTFLPVLPGLLLIWATGLAWVLLDGGGVARWLVFAVLSLLLVAGTLAKYVLPARSVSTAGAPRSTLILGVVGAVIGFFVIPVIGLLIGGVVGVLLAEWRRLGTPDAAWQSTRGVVLAMGIGILLELVAGVLMVLTWLGGAVLI